MSWAIIAVTVVSAGTAAYSASEKKKAAKKNLAATPQFSPVELDPIGGNGVYSQFFDQKAKIPEMEQFSNLLNKGFQRQLTSVSPNLMRNIGQLDRNASSQLKGLLPADVMSGAIRNSGYQALQGGFGGGSDQGRGLAARNLGLTSLDLMSQGQQSLQNSIAASTAVNPTNPINWIFTPQAIQGRQDQNAYYNSNLGQQNQLMQYKATTDYNTIAAANNPWVAGIQAGVSAYTGMGGMGGGSPSASSPQSQQTFGAGYQGQTSQFGGAYAFNMGGQSVYRPAPSANTNQFGYYNGNNGPYTGTGTPMPPSYGY